MSDRNFHLHPSGEGRYVSKTPAGAARKAGAIKLRKSGGSSVEVAMRESGSDKIFRYMVHKVKVAEDDVYHGSGGKFACSFKYTTKAI